MPINTELYFHVGNSTVLNSCLHFCIDNCISFDVRSSELTGRWNFYPMTNGEQLKNYLVNEMKYTEGVDLYVTARY